LVSEIIESLGYKKIFEKMVEIWITLGELVEANFL